ncbi:carboxypeptidase-like regulatory domain-containing protein [Hymenobacter terricola]|uniref:carboxypeptidase-like regulatory domain-containing protein n=1 Tax=Hymenobacter terricola TaxID=2819236 RepID=UPI001B309D21|nr:carboxypeptidase-like regulatory domain-containing protein [Hymenobacter terricola]
MPDFLRLRFPSLFFAVALLGVLFLAAPSAHAQGKRKIIQFTGIVATGDSLLGVPGATVYVPKAGRGTTSNAYGYFSMAVLAGDSIVIRSLGYANQTIIIPKDFQRQSYSVIITLKEDVTVLPEVRVFPYTTERDFKKAFLALRLPTERGSAAADNLNQELMNRIFRTQPVGAVANFRQTMQTQAYDQDRRNGIAPNQYSNNPLLNPFSWLQLIQQVKKGEFKKKNTDDDY